MRYEGLTSGTTQAFIEFNGSVARSGQLTAPHHYDNVNALSKEEG